MSLQALNFVKKYPHGVRRRVFRSIFAYLFGLTPSLKFRKSLAFLPQEDREAIFEVKKDLLDGSMYAIQLHRAVVRYRDKGNLLSTSYMFGVRASDIRLVEQYVPLNKIPYIPYEAKWELEVFLPTLHNYAKYIVYKARFIHRYDISLTKEDFVQDVLTEGIRVWRIIAEKKEFDLLKLLNYVRASMKNHVGKIIDHYTAQRRRRLRKSKEDSREYEAPVVSLDASLLEPKEDYQTTTNSKLLHDQMQTTKNKRVKKCVQAMLGNQPEFDRWVLLSKQKSPNKLSYTMLIRLAAQWAGVKLEQVQKELLPLYEGLAPVM